MKLLYVMHGRNIQLTIKFFENTQKLNLLLFQKEGIHSCKSQFFHKNEYPHEKDSIWSVSCTSSQIMLYLSPLTYINIRKCIKLHGIKIPDPLQEPYNCWRIKPDFLH